MDSARALWHRVLDDVETSWVDAAPTAEHLADSYRTDAQELAAFYYREVERLSPTGSATSGTHQIRLAQLLLDTGSDHDLEEVELLLNRWIESTSGRLPSQLFLWNVTFIHWALRLGADEPARDAARRAVDLAARGPVFTRHPTVGVVVADETTLDWLHSLAEPDERPETGRPALWRRMLSRGFGADRSSR
ncbi:hypothetical protein [Microbacterium natoriense]|uniref:hypothetical protein n=1 Tax=Microbacterium natoriense TaxID=284570 RepID=UPI0027D85163|nr:hypothetical protein [Microbacterium natoriense]